MSRPKSSWGDIANFGVGVYQSRQMSKMASAQQEQTAVLMAQLEQIERQSQLEQMQREVLKQARSLIVDMSEAANEVEIKSKADPILASIEADALVESFKNAISGGLDIDLFEDINDIERFRALEKVMQRLSIAETSLTEEQKTVKNKILLYTKELPVLEEATSLADSLPVLEEQVFFITKKHQEALPHWEDLKLLKRKENEKVNRNAWVAGTVVSFLCTIFMIIPLVDSSFFGLFTAGDGFAEMIGGGSCCLLILALGGVFSYHGERTRVIIDSYDSLQENASPSETSPVAELEERLAMYLRWESEDPGLWTDEIEQLRQEISRQEIGNQDSVSELRLEGLEPSPFSVDEIDLIIDDPVESVPVDRGKHHAWYRFEDRFESMNWKYSVGAPKVRALREWLSEKMDYFQATTSAELSRELEVRRDYISGYPENLAQSPDDDGYPAYSLIGNMHDSGYEVIQYPEGFGPWYWKDVHNKRWVLWT